MSSPVILKPQYIDRVEVMETVCNELRVIQFLDEWLHVEFVALRPRMDQAGQVSHAFVTSARLALSVQAMVSLQRHLNDQIGQLVQKGALKPIDPSPSAKQ